MAHPGIYLICCTDILLNDLKQKVPSKGIASTYALAIRSWSAGADEPDWKKINEAIEDDRGQRGLENIKREAWKIIDRHTAHTQDK